MKFTDKQRQKLADIQYHITQALGEIFSAQATGVVDRSAIEQTEALLWSAHEALKKLLKEDAA